MSVNERSQQLAPTTKLTSAGRNAFWSSFGGWAMDGYNWTIFGLVLAPAMARLLPASGYADSTDNVGYFGQISSAIFLLGWGCSFIWGPIADRFGRRPAMMGSILTYAVFTALAGLATNVWEWNAFRFLCAVGVGGEWAMAGTLVAESVPERVRVRFGGFLHSAAYVGVFFAAMLYLLAGQYLGWRGMFFLGLLPAVLIFVIRRKTVEPQRWRDDERDTTASLWRPLGDILRAPYRRRTWVNLVLLVVCVIGLWAGSTYVPTAMTTLAQHAHYAASTTVHLASLSAGLVAIATILGCWSVPWLAGWLGRRGALIVLFILMIIGTVGAYGFAYADNNIGAFFGFLPVLGFGGANFAVFTIWLPEQYPTSVRATAFAFVTTVSRWVAAAGTFLIGYGIHASGSLSLPLAATAIPFLVGIGLALLATETRGQSLPE
ncbi:MAG TPA: MFS transporter [Pseudonocardiaceae bacterium]|nr:MFS transporter [Pseudonocardiaceae bacterium]